MTTQAYRETLPAHYFRDARHHEREFGAIWRREWICIGREEDWAKAGDFQRIRIGEEQIIVTRAADGALYAFHNTCRHRGSVLCEADSGTFAGGRIVCPYHAWTYTLDGNLERVPRLRESAVVRREDFPLYRVALQNWRGFVFVNLGAGHRGGEPAQTLRDALGDEAAAVQAWPLEDLRRAHRIRHRLACNWKIYWENYLECYHCPGVHPQLCKLVPVYRTGYMDYAAAGLEPDPERPGSMLNPGAVTWSVGGATALPWFDGLGERERRAGMTFATFLPTMFLVAHVDYVRTVRILPLGPEQTELTVDWYVQRDVIGHPQLDVERLSEFGNLVVTQDARVCELNQQGIRCSRHERGVLLAQEDHVYEFEQWVRARLDDARS